MMLGGQELARILDLSPETIRHYAEEGLIPCQRTPGGHRRYDLDDVRRALRDLKPRTFIPLDEGPDILLDPDAEQAPPFRRARRFRVAITSGMLADAIGMGGERRTTAPFIGVPGSSRFIVGQGARA